MNKIGKVILFFLILQLFFQPLPHYAQEVSLFGWQPFHIPGLPENEQITLRGMLLSDNPTLQLEALDSLYRGVSSGRISSASEEYSFFLEQVFQNLFLVRSQQNHNSFILTHPKSILTFLDLLVFAENNLFQSVLVQLFNLSSEPFVYHHAMRLIDRHGKIISRPLENALSQILVHQATRTILPDGSLIRSILQAYRRSFLLHETRMTANSVQALLVI